MEAEGPSSEPVYVAFSPAASSAALAGPQAAASASVELQLPLVPKPSARPRRGECEDLESTFLLGVPPRFPRSFLFSWP